MLKTLKRLAFAGMFLLPLGAVTAGAQTSPTTPGDTIVTSPSLEGSTIKNVASASYTDSNNNPYTDVKDSVTITVGFLAAPDPSGAVSYSPKAPSTGNIADFYIKNSGNGTDSATVNFTPTSGLSITGYSYNGTSYATLALLNAFIKTLSMPAGTSLPFPIRVTYSVTTAYGGDTTNSITLVQTSVRKPTKSAKWRTAILPPVFDSVTVTPDSAKISKVITNAKPAYTYTFRVYNRGNRPNNYAMTASVTAGTTNGTVKNLSIVGSNKTGFLIPGGFYDVDVSYKVFDGTAPDQIVLLAVADSGSAGDTGDVTVTKSKASLTFTKLAYASIASPTPLTNTAADAVVPGVTFYYKLSVTNAANSADATGVVMTDILGAGLQFVGVTPDVAADWTVTPTNPATPTDGPVTVTATLKTGVVIPAASAARYIWIAAKVRTVVTPPAP